MVVHLAFVSCDLNEEIALGSEVPVRSLEVLRRDLRQVLILICDLVLGQVLALVLRLLTIEPSKLLLLSSRCGKVFTGAREHEFVNG